ncbi:MULTISPECIES: hypothetical protein [Actinomadura]|uniref:DUF3558 domain-containing protein n=1 Tax=Actinomadura yumaensis TaxID=111807 RepID=A0ABW2CG05_9ACTN|nr:hypothetical protein [Actinomadura sp. J1-007]MWK34500.1 hypothetical protein [Actinomadura sp. J1-007]
MTEDPRNPRPMFLPPEAEPQAVPEEPPVLAPEGTRAFGRLLVAGVACAVLVLLAVFRVWDAPSSEGDVKHSSAKPMIRTLPAPCEVVGRATIERVVPAATELPVVHRAGGDPSASCQWEASSPATDRRLRVTMTAYRDGRISSGADSATGEVDETHARMEEERTQEPLKPPRFSPRRTTAVAWLSGVGHAAVESYSVIGTASGYNSGQADIGMSVGNTFVAISYGGSDDDQGRDVPLADGPAREAARSIAREIANSLIACGYCAN